MRFQSFFFFYQLIAQYSRCSFTEAKALIGQNVRPAMDHEFTFVVGIIKSFSRNRLPYNYVCAGTLISKNDVLTSEHCLATQQMNGLRIIIGSSNLSRGTQYYPEWWISYDQWAIRNEMVIELANNDIAILNLLDRVPDAIEFLHLSIISKNRLNGLNVQTAGWGLTANHTISMNLQTVSLTVLSNEDCSLRVQNLIGRPVNADRRTICTVANPYALLRNRDSGGPLLFGNIIVAVNFRSIPGILPDTN